MQAPARSHVAGRRPRPLSPHVLLAVSTAGAIAGSIAIGAALQGVPCGGAPPGLPSAAAPPPGSARGVAPAPAAASAAPPAGPFTVLTFNAGLAVGVLPLARERVALVTEQLAREPADLICAQELWQEDHWSAAAAALSSRLPHTLRPAAAPTIAGARCSAADIAPLESCHRASCSSARPAELASCMIGRCAHLAGSMDAGCVSCLLREPWPSIPALRQACAEGDAAAPQRLLQSPRRGAPLAFGGATGTGILSSVPFAETEVLELPSTWARRAVLYARLDRSPVGPMHVFCTHLSAQLGSVPMPPGQSWQREHAEQVRLLLELVDRKRAARPAPVVLLGDLNTGPAIPGRSSGKLPAHYARLEGAGLVAPFAHQPDARCTYCFDNPLVGTGSGGLLIDHVLLGGFPGRATGRRILDRPQAITVEGQRRTTPPSDHYGLSVVLSR